MLLKKIVTSLIILLIGVLLGWVLKPQQIIKTEFKTIRENVSVCDKAQTDYERAVCFAKDSCPLGVKTFTYNGLKTQTDYVCRGVNE